MSGWCDGGRLLSRPSLEVMTTDQLTPEQNADPSEDMVTILMTGCAKFTLNPPNLYRNFWTLAYQAIDD